LDTLCDGWSEVCLEEIFCDNEVGETVLEEAIVGVVDPDFWHRQ